MKSLINKYMKNPTDIKLHISGQNYLFTRSTDQKRREKRTAEKLSPNKSNCEQMFWFYERHNLPQTLRHSDTTSSFKAALKTHLFNNYF